MSGERNSDVAVVIPCYRVSGQIARVISAIPATCAKIYVVDDACPEGSGRRVQELSKDLRVTVLFHPSNQGVGGAVLTGMRQAFADGAEIAVKIDGDGQMDPALLPLFVEPIRRGVADYTKGNRFFRPADVERMPSLRLFGNAALSFFSKFSSGYWNVFDPTNGYIAIHASAFRSLPHEKIHRRFFFESDLLFRLYLSRAVVVDVPMTAVYAQESSNLKIGKVLLEFPWAHVRNFTKRILYTYFLRDFSEASIELVLGISLIAFGGSFGLHRWITLSARGVEASAGTVMVAALPIIVGFQLLLSFLSVDRQNVPRQILPRIRD